MNSAKVIEWLMVQDASAAGSAIALIEDLQDKLAACEARWAAATSREQTQYDAGEEWRAKYDELAGQVKRLQELTDRIRDEAAENGNYSAASFVAEFLAALAASQPGADGGSAGGVAG